MYPSLRAFRTRQGTGILHDIELTATYPFESKRYHRGPFSPYELALSLKPNSYLSHGTAAYLHNLTDHEFHTIYVNKEQSAKDSSSERTQAGINRAFSAKQRTSGFHFRWPNDDHTSQRKALGPPWRHGYNGVPGRAARGNRPRTHAHRHRCTPRLRRRRPARADRLSPFALKGIGRSHCQTSSPARLRLSLCQAIGFYLESTGHASADLDVLRKPKLKFDFFLAHGVKHTRFDDALADPLSRGFLPPRGSWRASLA